MKTDELEMPMQYCAKPKRNGLRRVAIWLPQALYQGQKLERSSNIL